jgi:hypothetical protein
MNADGDSYLQTKYRSGCPAAKKESFENSGFTMNQLNSALKSIGAMASSSAGIENFASVQPKYNSMDIADDISGTYGLPWAPY